MYVRRPSGFSRGPQARDLPCDSQRPPAVTQCSSLRCFPIARTRRAASASAESTLELAHGHVRLRLEMCQPFECGRRHAACALHHGARSCRGPDRSHRASRRRSGRWLCSRRARGRGGQGPRGAACLRLGTATRDRPHAGDGAQHGQHSVANTASRRAEEFTVRSQECSEAA